jgi:hypothetical protein
MPTIKFANTQKEGFASFKETEGPDNICAHCGGEAEPYVANGKDCSFVANLPAYVPIVAGKFYLQTWRCYSCMDLWVAKDIRLWCQKYLETRTPKTNLKKLQKEVDLYEDKKQAEANASVQYKHPSTTLCAIDENNTSKSLPAPTICKRCGEKFAERWLDKNGLCSNCAQVESIRQTYLHS